MFALPLVAALWVTVGLPVLSQLTNATGGNRLSRKVVFEAHANGQDGGAAGGAAAPLAEATATVSKQVLAAYHAEVLHRAQARARATKKAKQAAPALPRSALPSTTPATATLATADQPSAPTNQPADTTAPAKDKSPGPDKSPGTGNSDGGSGASVGQPGGAGVGSGTGGVQPAPDPGSPGGAGGSDNGGTGNSGDTGGTAGDTGSAGDAGDTGGHGAGGIAPPTAPPPNPQAPSVPAPPAAPPAPPVAPPAPPAPPAPSGPLPMPADIQTTSGGGPRGKPGAGDAVVFTFASPPDPSLILPGWDGSATSVTLRITDNGKNDTLAILDATTGAPLTALGSVQLGGDYVDKKTVDVPGSRMTLTGNVLRVVLGTPSVKSFDQQKTGTMIWTTPSGTATESGPADNEF